MFKVSSASLQTFVDTPNRVQYSMVHIVNVFCDGHLQLINCVLYCNRQVHRDFFITLYKLCELKHGAMNRRNSLLIWAVENKMAARGYLN